MWGCSAAVVKRVEGSRKRDKQVAMNQGCGGFERRNQLVCAQPDSANEQDSLSRLALH